MHEVRNMQPLTKAMTKKESKLMLARLSFRSVRQVDVLKRAFIFRAYSLGIGQSQIGRLTGNSRQRIRQIIIRATESHPDLIGVIGHADDEQVKQMIALLDQYNVSSLWEESEEFQFAMLKWVGINA